MAENKSASPATGAGSTTTKQTERGEGDTPQTQTPNQPEGTTTRKGSDPAPGEVGGSGTTESKGSNDPNEITPMIEKDGVFQVADKYTVAKDQKFHDKNDFGKVYGPGTDVSHLEPKRLDGLVSAGIVIKSGTTTDKA